MLRRALLQQLPIALRAAPCATQASHQVLAAAYSTSSYNHEKSWAGSAAWTGAAVAFAASAYAASNASIVQADAAPQAQLQAPADPYVLPSATGHLPKNITLYQYEVCPFCCKVKAFLDYHKLPYQTIEVNPLTKGELKWSTYRKVPVVKLEDEVVVDSSAIISRLAAELQQANGTSSTSRSSSSKSWFSKGSSSSSSDSSSAEEERRWRKWVDERYVKLITANIYRSWDESWDTFGYMTEQSHWNWAVQQSVRVAGAVLMWQVGSRMPKKYGITGDLREALYKDTNEFIDAVGTRKFMGGDRPNLADLAVYGVLTAVKGTPTYNDVILNTNIGQWLSRMVQTVGDSCEIKQVPGKEDKAAATAP